MDWVMEREEEEDLLLLGIRKLFLLLLSPHDFLRQTADSISEDDD